MRIAIAGASGLLGRATADHLRSTGHQVVTLVRRPPQNLDERLWFPDEGRITAPGLSDVDAVINFCGAGIADERWSQQRKELLRSSRLNPTTTIVAALIGRSVQVEWLQKLVRSRIAQLALAREGQEIVTRLTEGSAPPSRLAKMLAKSFYRDLASAGFSSGQIIEAASEIIGQISGDLARHKKRMGRENCE